MLVFNITYYLTVLEFCYNCVKTLISNDYYKDLKFKIRYLDIKQSTITLSDAIRLKNLRKKPDLTFVRIYHTGIRSKKFDKKIHLVRNIKDTCCEKFRPAA